MSILSDPPGVPTGHGFDRAVYDQAGLSSLVGLICSCGYWTDLCESWGQAGQRLDNHFAGAAPRVDTVERVM